MENQTVSRTNTRSRDKIIKDETRDMIIEKQRRQMTSVRREITGVFKKYEHIVKKRLGVISREAHQVYEDEETDQSTEDRRKVDPEEIRSKMEEKVSKMIELKKELEERLEPLKPKGESKSTEESASKGTKRSQSLNEEWEERDIYLEMILENAAIDDKGEDFDLLPISLRKCLLCLSIFPFCAHIAKRVLIYWWIGEGFVQPKPEEHKTAEQVGEDTFNDLLKRGFIQPVYNRRSGVIVKCKMHPWIHWMLISKATDYEFFVFDDTGMPSSSPSKKKRACLISKSGDGRNERNPYKPHEELKALFNLDVQYLDLDNDSFSKMKRIVVLQLGRWMASDEHHIEMKPEILERLSKLIHLKYLSLRGISLIETLPKSIQKLQNLMVLDLRGCQNLRKLTEGITWLKKLTHLDVSECYMLESMPKGLSSMSGLEVLKGFVISNSAKAGRIIDLSKLPKLKKLSIVIGSQVKRNPDLEELASVRRLCSLTIIWSDLPKTIPSYEEHSVDKLKIPHNIEKLDLRCYPSSNMPKWLEPNELQNLKRLYIRGGKLEKLNLKEKETNNQKWKIKVLRLRFLFELKMEWPHIDIQSLNHLEFANCRQLEIGGKAPQMDKDGVWTKIDDAPTTSDVDSSLPEPAADATAPQPHDVTAPTTTLATTTTVPSLSPSATAPSPPPGPPPPPPTTTTSSAPPLKTTPNDATSLPPPPAPPSDNDATSLPPPSAPPSDNDATGLPPPPAPLSDNDATSLPPPATPLETITNDATIPTSSAPLSETTPNDATTPVSSPSEITPTDAITSPPPPPPHTLSPPPSETIPNEATTTPPSALPPPTSPPPTSTPADANTPPPPPTSAPPADANTPPPSPTVTSSTPPKITPTDATTCPPGLEEKSAHDLSTSS